MPILQEKEIISATKNLFIFNPEHDFALAVGEGPYTPPAEIIKIRKKYSLLPASFAGNGDFVIVPDELENDEIPSLPFYNKVKKHNITLLRWKDLKEYSDLITQIFPWGWDHAVFNQLVVHDINQALLPSIDDINIIRQLSHRRTAITFRKEVAEVLQENPINLPSEIFTLEDVGKIMNQGIPYYFKAPWSSSGRGIVVSDHISSKGLTEWAHGILRRQGSIIAEPAWNRVFDFASEWWISEGNPRFLGLSVFQTSSCGKYHGNISLSQKELLCLINHYSPTFSNDIIWAQETALRKLVAPSYSGPLGIDMLTDIEGQLNPCVEINLRFTMGHLPIWNYNLSKD